MIQKNINFNKIIATVKKEITSTLISTTITGNIHNSVNLVHQPAVRKIIIMECLAKKN